MTATAPGIRAASKTKVTLSNLAPALVKMIISNPGCTAPNTNPLAKADKGSCAFKKRNPATCLIERAVREEVETALNEAEQVLVEKLRATNLSKIANQSVD
ncbi:MAG: hypothetical protein RIC24_01690 [Hyphomicrobiales bacterium]